ncbi:hypothetical protein BDB13_5784 [Rhodococcus sp. OK302]|nr:hypothetical protein BDB13_5784 [Rhodococcus sp. OK302]
MDGLTLRAISSKGPPAAEIVTAALVVRSLQLLRDIDPVFGVDLYQSVGDDLPDDATVEQMLASNVRQVLVPPTEESIEAALIESRRSPYAAGGMFPLSLRRHISLYSDAGDIHVLAVFGDNSGAGSFVCTFADESRITLALRLVQGLTDIWDAHTAVLYRRAESPVQRYVPGGATIGSCTYLGQEFPIDETQLPPTVEAFPYRDGTVVIQRDLSAPLASDDIRSIRAAASLPTERPEIRLPKGSRRVL